MVCFMVFLPLLWQSVSSQYFVPTAQYSISSRADQMRCIWKTIKWKISNGIRVGCAGFWTLPPHSEWTNQMRALSQPNVISANKGLVTHPLHHKVTECGGCLFWEGRDSWSKRKFLTHSHTEKTVQRYWWGLCITPCTWSCGRCFIFLSHWGWVYFSKL